VGHGERDPLSGLESTGLSQRPAEAMRETAPRNAGGEILFAAAALGAYACYETPMSVARGLFT
jgi:hypothetical protein